MCLKQVSSFHSLLFLLFVAIHSINGHLNDQFRVVETTNGRVQGFRRTTLLRNIPFYSFKGIPYAKPPIGHLRFKVRSLPYIPSSIVFDGMTAEIMNNFPMLGT